MSANKENSHHHKSAGLRKKCPYCLYKFEDAPKRKKKCPNCGNYIYVKKETLLTQEEADIRNWIERLYISRKNFDRNRDILSEKFGKVASVNDTIWAILNAKTQSRDLFERRVAYYEMSNLALAEGKDSKLYIKAALETKLLELKKDGFKEVIIVGYGGRNDDPNTCEKCREEIGKKYKIDDVLKEMPIPAVCENPDGCRCDYEPVNYL